MVRSAAVRSVRSTEEAPERRHAGSIPLSVQARRENFANANGGRGEEGCSDPVWVYVCCAILALVFGLRRKEMRSAILKPTADWRIIRISFHPKGKARNPRVVAYRYAFGVCGFFEWWPRFYARFVGAATLEPALDRAKLFEATTVLPGVAPPSNTFGVQLLEHPSSPCSLEPTVLASLRLTRHSDHGADAADSGRRALARGDDRGGELCREMHSVTGE